MGVALESGAKRVAPAGADFARMTFTRPAPSMLENSRCPAERFICLGSMTTGSKAGKAGRCAKCCACCTLAPTRNAWSFVPVAGRLDSLDECSERAQEGRTALLDSVCVVSNIVKAVGEIRGEQVCVKVR